MNGRRRNLMLRGRYGLGLWGRPVSEVQCDTVRVDPVPATRPNIWGTTSRRYRLQEKKVQGRNVRGVPPRDLVVGCIISYPYDGDNSVDCREHIPI